MVCVYYRDIEFIFLEFVICILLLVTIYMYNISMHKILRIYIFAFLISPSSPEVAVILFGKSQEREFYLK